jgi:hypothetical protein
MRPSDLDDADLPAAERQLITAADEGRIVCEPAGSDALWCPPRSSDEIAPRDSDGSGPRLQSPRLAA